MLRPLAAAGAILSLALAAQAQAPPPRFEGTWDLIWQTRRGPRQSGYIVLRQRGAVLTGELHGEGSVNAAGETSGARFVLRGSRMLVPYRIEGSVEGDRMEGAFKAMSVERRFTGARRR